MFLFKEQQHQLRRAANRHLLPLEICLGWVTLSWGLSGGFGTGHLHDLLDVAASSTAWLLMLTGVGMSQSAAALIEWLSGGSWSLERRWRAARFRLGVNFISILSWLWVMKLMWDYPNVAHEVFVLVLVGPAMIFFEAWAAFDNYKVRLAADEKIDTENTLILR